MKIAPLFVAECGVLVIGNIVIGFMLIAIIQLTALKDGIPLKSIGENLDILEFKTRSFRFQALYCLEAVVDNLWKF